MEWLLLITSDVWRSKYGFAIRVLAGENLRELDMALIFIDWKVRINFKFGQELCKLPKENRIIRALTCYSNSDEKLVFEVQLQDFKLSEFQREFHIQPDNPMYDCYIVVGKNIPFLNPYLPMTVGINWDFTNYSYFIEAYED